MSNYASIVLVNLCICFHRWSTRTLNHCIPPFCLWKQGTEERYWEWRICQMERAISVRPVRPVKVDHRQRWSLIFRSDQTEMVRSIWCTNLNYRNFGLNGKRPLALEYLLWKNVNTRDTRSKNYQKSKYELIPVTQTVYQVRMIRRLLGVLKYTLKLMRMGFYFSWQPGFHYVPSFLFNINLIPPFRSVNNSSQLRNLASMTIWSDFSLKDFIDDLQAINWDNICNHT